MLLPKFISVSCLFLIVFNGYVENIPQIDLGISDLINFDIPFEEIVSLLNFDPDTILNFTGIAILNGYKSEEHFVTTQDGYILTFHRITNPNCTEIKAVPVFLMHGLASSSDIYLDAGTENGLAYLIANECRDVWAGNYRGNYYGRTHVRYNPDTDAEFWHFSVDEMATYDIPAQINYIRQLTNKPKVTYIGFSIGGSLPLLTSTDFQSYVEEVFNLFIGLAPLSRTTNTRSPVLRLLLEGSTMLEQFQRGNGLQEVLYRGSIAQTFYATLCQTNNILVDTVVCPSLFALIDSYHVDSITKETLASAYLHCPAGFSIRTLTWLTSTLNGIVRKFDFGAEENQQVYGSTEPPNYDFTKFTIPTVLIHGLNDRVIDTVDIEWLKNQLPNVLELFTVVDPEWNHFDMAYSQNIKTATFPTIKKYLDLYV